MEVRLGLRPDGDGGLRERLVLRWQGGAAGDLADGRAIERGEGPCLVEASDVHGPSR